MRISGDVVEAIGNTPIVQLRKVVPRGSARVLAKLEFTNPTGSMKDRVAKAMVEAAAADGMLKPGQTVVEYTAGTTGISLALVCAAKGFGSHMVYSDAFSQEKLLTMKAFRLLSVGRRDLDPNRRQARRICSSRRYGPLDSRRNQGAMET